MKTQHTPGPWKISKHCSTLVESGDRSIASAGGYQSVGADAHEVNEANAKLIAAAPDLLAILRECVDFLPPGYIGLHQRMRDTIKKATT